MYFSTSSFVELPLPTRKQMCLDAQFICQNLLDLQMDSYSPCVEVETIAKPKSGDINVRSTKNGERIETFLDVLFYCRCFLLYPQLDLGQL
ncbi:hypothetical protein Peur_012830 [Populus x canadensis]